MTNKSPSHNLHSLGFSENPNKRQTEHSLENVPLSRPRNQFSISDQLKNPDVPVESDYNFPSSIQNKFRVQQLTSDLLAAEQARSSLLEAELNSLRNINQQISEDLSSSRQIYENQIDSLSNLRISNSHLENQLAQANKHISQLSYNNEYLTQELLEITEQHKALTIENKDQQKVLEQFQPTIKSLKVELQRMQAWQDKNLSAEKQLNDNNLQLENLKLRNELQKFRKYSTAHKNEIPHKVQPTLFVPKHPSSQLEKNILPFEEANTDDSDLPLPKINGAESKVQSLNTHIQANKPIDISGNNLQTAGNDGNLSDKHKLLNIRQEESSEDKNMICQNCGGKDNPPIAKFCGDCGSILK